MRLTAGAVNSVVVGRYIRPDTTLAYERFASMQQLGKVAQRRGIPWVLETQGPFFMEASADRRTMLLTDLAKRIELDAYRRCDVLICVSSALRDLVVEASGIDPSKVLVVPNGVDGTTFDPAATPRLRLTDEETFTIGYVGSLPRWQALDRLFESIVRVRSRLGEVAIVIVGTGAMCEAWERHAEALGLSDVVHWVGAVSRDDIPTYIQGMDVGFSGQIPSSAGSMYHSPLKLYEYQAMGVPFVASSFEDARSLAETTGGGVLFEAGYDDSLDNAILEAHRLHRAGHFGRDVIRSRTLRYHSWEQRVGQILEGVEDVLQRRLS